MPLMTSFAYFLLLNPVLLQLIACTYERFFSSPFLGTIAFKFISILSDIIAYEVV